MSKKYKKIDTYRMENEPFQVQPYFKTLSVKASRFKFKLVSRMTPRVANNFKNDKRFKAIGWACVGCLSNGPITGQLPLDTEEHILLCGSYADLRENKSMDSDQDIITYFQQVIERREKDEHILSIS